MQEWQLQLSSTKVSLWHLPTFRNCDFALPKMDPFGRQSRRNATLSLLILLWVCEWQEACTLPCRLQSEVLCIICWEFYFVSTQSYWIIAMRVLTASIYLAEGFTWHLLTGFPKANMWRPSDNTLKMELEGLVAFWLLDLELLLHQMLFGK